MTDAELAIFLGIAGTKDCAAILSRVTPAERATYESMATFEHEVRLWQDGLAPKPKGVIICGCRGRKPGHAKCGRR